MLFSICGFIMGQNVDFELSITINKSNYFINEPIYLTVTILNSSLESKQIVTSMLSEYNVGVDLLGPNGSYLKSQRFMINDSIGHQGPFADSTLEPGETYVVEHNLVNLFPQIIPEGGFHSIDSLGTYTLQCKYVNTIDSIKNNEYWVGEMLSNSIQFELIPWDQSGINQLTALLLEGTHDEKLEALVTIRKAELTQLLDNVHNILISTNSEEIKITSAFTLYFLAETKYFEVYMELLNSPNQKLRGLGAVSLGKIKDTRALPILIEMCDPELYPMDYGPAYRALVDMGDNRALPAFEKIANSNSVPKDFRKAASREAKGIRQSIKYKTD